MNTSLYVLITGCDRQGEEVISEVGKAITVEDIPRFLVELGRLVAAQNATYEEWSKVHHGELEALIGKYTQ